MNAFAQTPATDDHWKLHWGDEFDVATYNGATHKDRIAQLCNKWWITAGNNPSLNISTDSEGENIDVNNGICTLSVSQLSGNCQNRTYPCQHSPPQNCAAVTLPTAPCIFCEDPAVNGTHAYQYLGTELISQQIPIPNTNPQQFESFKHGYFEIKYRLKDYSQSNLTLKQKLEKIAGIGAAFWLFPTKPVQNGHYQEIDIFETDPRKYCYKQGSTVHYDGTPAANYTHTMDEAFPRTPGLNSGDDDRASYSISHTNFFIQDFTSYHVVGLEWCPEFVALYVDGKQQYSLNWKQDLMGPMNIILSAWGGNYTSLSELPYNFMIDYIRVYKLDFSNLQSLVQLNYNYANLGDLIKSKIELGGSGGSAVVPNTSGTDTYNLRANEYIELKEGFECGTSSNFYAQVVTE